MKAIMYHYVRDRVQNLPYFRYLHIDEFCKQLDYFQSNFYFPSRAEFLDIVKGVKPVPENGIILTFDDGLKDHYDYAYKELKKRGLWGIFYIPTGMYTHDEMIDTQRIQHLNGRHGGAQILEWLQEMVEPHMIQHEKVEEFRQTTYEFQNNDSKTLEAKRILNYYLAHEWRKKILDRMMSDTVDEKEMIKSLYLSFDEMKEMADNGMIMGGHTITHPALSKLTRAQQKVEIEECLSFVHGIIDQKDVKTFCYPYGRKSTYTDETIQILKDNNVDFTFAVEHRDIAQDDIQSHIHALPRWDCNQFPHGTAHQGKNALTNASDVASTKISDKS